MREAIEQRGSQAFIAQDLNPVRKTQIGRDHQGDTFIQVGAEGEDQLRSGCCKGDEAELVQDH